MGEVGVVMAGEEHKGVETANTSTNTSSVVRWEKFLPKMVLRVLLVEADDSTRHIISALLRKCCYKVVAVSDGLKAWEVLKVRSHSIDLILTEVELPSISGFALLTLIVEHEACKNIPVIMMSTHDSVSTVYKCMLRGAADFLVKPVRKNELKNLWQHVWRRQASVTGGNEPQEGSDPQQKVEATAENNANSNHSSGYMACLQLNRECIEKGSDAQSSCTKPEMESDVIYVEHVNELTQSKRTRSLSADLKELSNEEHEKSSKKQRIQGTQAEGSELVACKHIDTVHHENEDAPDNHQECANSSLNGHHIDNHTMSDSCREAIDLIGAFDSFPKFSNGTSLNHGANKADVLPMLDLSLRRSYLSSSVNQVGDERHKLKQSDASAFSRYVNSASKPPYSGSGSICNLRKEDETNCDKQLSKGVYECNSQTHGPAADCQENTVTLVSGQQANSDGRFPSPKQRVFPVQVPVKGLRFQNQCNGYGSVLPPMFYSQAGMLQMQSPGSCGHPEPSFPANLYYMSSLEARRAQVFQTSMDGNANNPNDQADCRQAQEVESTDDRGHFSSANDQNASSSYCDDLSRFNNIGSGNETGFIHDRNSHRSVQREAALNKFRMKRKDRCYEKKVRYESRKKLAEQRPRVKGQFVRQVPVCMETEDQNRGSSPG